MCLLWCCAPFAQLSRANNAHNFCKISKCLPTFVLRKIQPFLHRFTANITRCLQACRVVICLLWWCAPYAQLYRANNAHNFRKNLKCLPTFVLRNIQTFLHRFTANITRCLQACRVVFACCGVLHPLHNFLDTIMHIISLKFQSVYPLLYYAKFNLFCTGLQQTYQGVYKHVELFFACCGVVHPLHNFLKPIMSLKFQCLPTFVLRKIQPFLRRFTANITRCLQACRVVICLLWCCAPFCTSF